MEKHQEKKSCLKKLLEPFEEEEALEEEEASEATPENLGVIAYNHLHRKERYPRDETYGIYLGKDGYYHMGKQKDELENKKKITITYNNIIVDDEKFRGTPGLWELIMESNPINYTRDDKDEYERLLIKANVLHCNFDPKKPYPRGSGGRK